MAGIFTEDAEKPCEIKKVIKLIDNGNYHKGAMLEHIRKAVLILLKKALK